MLGAIAETVYPEESRTGKPLATEGECGRNAVDALVELEDRQAAIYK